MKNTLESLNSKIGPKSPLPYILQLRNWIFGKVAPCIIVKLGFYTLMLIAFVFLFWNILSSVALNMQYVVSENKNVSIQEFLGERAIELEIHPDYILPKLLTFFAISAICWMVFLLGIVLFWRQKKVFFWICLGSILFYLGMALFYVGGLYFWEEFTQLDKIFLLVTVILLFFYRFVWFERN